MAENFIREFDSVCCDIVGFFGKAHIFSGEIGNFGINENMCFSIKKHYGDKIEIVPKLMKDLIFPLFKTKIFLNGKTYSADCFGKTYTPFDENCEFIEFFRVIDPDNDFKEFIKKIILFLKLFSPAI